MAKNIKRLVDLFDDFMRKRGLGSHFTPEQKVDFIHTASLEKFKELMGEEEGYQEGRPIPRINPATSKISFDLRNFKVNEGNTTISNGVVEYPPDIAYWEAVRVNGYPVEELDKSELGDRLKSHIDVPTETDPVMTIDSSGFRLYPNTISSNVELDYIKYPTKPVYTYNILNGRDIVYDDANSIDLDWPVSVHNDILIKALSYAGIPVKDADLINFAEIKDEKGI